MAISTRSPSGRSRRGARGLMQLMPATARTVAKSLGLAYSKARLTADRVGYMTHPNWVARSSRKVPEAVWSPRISGKAGLASTAAWYRKHGWL